LPVNSIVLDPELVNYDNIWDLHCAMGTGDQAVSVTAFDVLADRATIRRPNLLMRQFNRFRDYSGPLSPKPRPHRTTCAISLRLMPISLSM
jgi:hypothetical protein